MTRIWNTAQAHCNQQAMKRLASIIANIIGPKGKRSCAEIIFDLYGANGDLDPNVEQLVRKTLLLKRILAKYPQ